MKFPVERFSSFLTSHIKTKFLFRSLPLFLAGLFALWNLSSWPMRLQYPGDGSYGGDAIPLAEVLHLRQGLPTYAAASPEQYDGVNWGPLYYLVGAQLVDPEKPAYLPLRVLSVVGTLGCAVGSGLLTFWLARSFLAAALSPLLFLAYGFVSWHGTSVRCDSVALLLSFVGFLIAYRFRHGTAILLSTPFLLLGFIYKPLFPGSSMAILLFLLLEKRYRLAGKFGGLLVIGGLISLASFQFVVFPGQAFFHHFVLYNFLPFMWGLFVAGVIFFVPVLLLPFLGGVGFLRWHPNRLLSCYLGCSTLFSISAFSRAGNNTYYFLEVVLILSSLVAALLADKKTTTLRTGGLMACLGISLLCCQMWFTPATPRRQDFERDRAIQVYLREHFPNDTLALGYYTADLLRAGLKTPITNLYHYNQLIRKGILSDQALLDQLRDHRFGVILLTYDIQTQSSTHPPAYLTERLRQAILRNYVLAASQEMPAPQKFQEDDRWYVWVPPSRFSSSTAKLVNGDKRIDAPVGGR